MEKQEKALARRRHPVARALGVLKTLAGALWQLVFVQPRLVRWHAPDRAEELEPQEMTQYRRLF